MRNRHGLDVTYFQNELRYCANKMVLLTPEELRTLLRRTLARLEDDIINSSNEEKKLREVKNERL